MPDFLLELLNRLYPGYHALVMAHIGADPLAPARARLDALRLRAAQSGRDYMLLISHSHGGGVARQVAADAVALRAQGLRPLFLTTQFPDDPARAVEAAVYLHGLAADFAAHAMDDHTVLATDTIAHLSDAFRSRVCDADGLTWICGLGGQKAHRRSQWLSRFAGSKAMAQ